MAKKSNPKSQTKELNRARLEFLMRNPEKLRELKKLFTQNEKDRKKWVACIAELSGDNPKIKEAWDFLSQNLGYAFNKDFEETLMRITTLPAAKAGGWHFVNFAMANANRVMVHGGKEVFEMTKDELNEKFLDYLCQNAREIFTELTGGQPVKYLFVALDLSRTKEVILAEVDELITQHKKEVALNSEDIPQKRNKWLPLVNELQEVWDLYEGAGQQPWQKTFRKISDKVGRPLSTVKDQWRQAYKQIYDVQYDKDSKYTTEEKRRNADQLCSKCPHRAKGSPLPRCYNKSDWIPCQDYLKIAGKERSVKWTAYKDNILYHNNSEENSND
jgi:hypothetical protein